LEHYDSLSGSDMGL